MINCTWFLKWHMKLNHKTKSIVVSLSLVSAFDYGDLTLGCATLEEIQSLRILRVTFDYKLTLKMHLREVVSKATRNLGVVCRAGKIIDCTRLLRDCFNKYALSSLEYCARV